MADNMRIPPKSDEAEVSVLGSILIDNDAILSVSEFLRPEHFYNDNNGKIYEAMLKLYEDRAPIDIVTVSEKLRELKVLKRIGGKAFLAKLASDVPTAANVESYGQIIKQLSAKRELISSASRIVEKAFDEALPSGELLDMAEQEIFSLSQKHLRNIPTSLREVLTASFDRLDELQKLGSGLRGIPTGFVPLDNLLAGMQDSNLIILAARPGVGKTAFALNIARHVSVEEKQPTCIFSLEMSKEELVDRLLVRQGLIDAWKLKTGQLSEDDFSSLSEAMGVLAEAPLYIDDTPGLTVTELRTKARRLQVDKGIRFIVVDYLQLMHGQTRDNRVQEVSEISQGLKNLARELKLPILALAQLSRTIEQRGGRPKLSDLRESGSIEQDADVVMFLSRDDEEVREMVSCSVEKHRNGPVGGIPLYFNGKQISFFDVEKKPMPQKA
ncbi:MAG TPA: replicative DNA helicase [Patescibacteria group bacterium]